MKYTMEKKKETFKVLVTWHCARVVEVEAETHDEALRFVEDNFDLQEAIDDSDSFDYILSTDYHDE